MTDTASPVTLESLDIFELLKLGHLTDQDKAAYSIHLMELVFNRIVAEDLPLFMSSEEITKLSELMASADKQKEGVELLKNKVPDFDNLLKDKTLILKKEMVIDNVEERMTLNGLEKQQLEKIPDGEDKNQKLSQNSQQKQKLDEILQAIGVDDWKIASEGIKNL
jgi:hypothetical protein